MKISVILFFIGIAFCQCSFQKEQKIIHRESVDIAKSPWGVEFNPMVPHINIYKEDWNPVQLNGKIDKMVAEANELGIKWVRFSVNWSTIQDDQGKYDFGYVDRVVDGLKKSKIEVMLCLNGGHRKFTRDVSVRGDTEMKAWLELLDTMTLHFRGRIRYWEIWNEPNTIWFWKPAPRASEYLELVKQSSLLIRKNIHDPVIIGGSLARLDLPFADTLSQLGIARYIHVISFHPYNEFPEAIVKKMQVPVKTPVQYIEPDHSVYLLKKLYEPQGIRVWQAECGYPSAANGTGWNGNGPWGEQIQGKWILRRMLIDLYYGSGVSNYFCFAESPDDGEKFNSKGLLKRKTLERKPAFDVFRNLTNTVNGDIQITEDSGMKVRITDEGGFKGFKPGDVFSCSFTKNGHTRYIAYWLPWRMQESVQGATISLETEGMHHPVMIDLLKGSVTSLFSGGTMGEKKSVTVPLFDYPLLISWEND